MIVIYVRHIANSARYEIGLVDRHVVAAARGNDLASISGERPQVFLLLLMLLLASATLFTSLFRNAARQHNKRHAAQRKVDLAARGRHGGELFGFEGIVVGGGELDLRPRPDADAPRVRGQLVIWWVDGVGACLIDTVLHHFQEARRNIAFVQWAGGLHRGNGLSSGEITGMPNLAIGEQSDG